MKHNLKNYQKQKINVIFNLILPGGTETWVQNSFKMYIFSTNVVVFNHKQNQMTFVVNIEVNWQGDVIKSFELRNSRTGELANFIAVLAPDFFSSGSGSGSGSGSWFFSQAAPAPAPGIFFLAASALAPAPRG